MAFRIELFVFRVEFDTQRYLIKCADVVTGLSSVPIHVHLFANLVYLKIHFIIGWHIMIRCVYTRQPHRTTRQQQQRRSIKNSIRTQMPSDRMIKHRSPIDSNDNDRITKRKRENRCPEIQNGHTHSLAPCTAAAADTHPDAINSINSSIHASQNERINLYVDRITASARAHAHDCVS